MNQIKVISIREFPIPSTQDLERQFLADSQTEPGMVGEMMRYVNEDSFTSDPRRSLFCTIRDRFLRGQPFDFMTLQSIHGDDFINEMISPGFQGGYSRDVVSHAILLRDAAARRRAYIVNTEMLRECCNRENTASDIYAKAESALHKINDDGLNVGEKPIASVLKTIEETLEERREMRRQGKLTRIPTGFKLLDWHTYKGWGPGQLIVLAARPSVGKTAVMLRFVVAAAGAGFKVYVITLEMTSEELVQRLYYGTEKVSPTDMASGFVIQEEFDAASEELRKLPVIINEESRSLEEIMTRITLNVMAGKCDIAMVDYGGLVKVESGWRENRNQEMAKITGELKALAKRLKIPIILLCQLNRESAKGDRPPELYDLRDSGAIEQDADIVMMLENDTAIEPTTGLRDILLWLRKNRQYKKDVCIRLRPNKTYSNFTEVGQDDDSPATESDD